MTRHAKYNKNFPLGNEAREMKVNALKSNLCKRTVIFRTIV